MINANLLTAFRKSDLYGNFLSRTRARPGSDAARYSRWITVIVLMNLLLSHPYSNSNADELIWGQNVGPVSAYVDQTDHANGLTIRASPSEDSQTIGHLPSGTKIRGSSEFKSGWVKLKSPVDTGWVNIGFLKPLPIEGMVTKVDNAELCLPIRAGPAASQQKVGCSQIGEALNLTGIMTADKWLQLADRRGWVDASSIQLPIEAPQAVGSDTVTPSTASVGPAPSPSGEKAVTKPSQLESVTKKELAPQEPAATPPVTTTRSAQITAKPTKTAPDKEKLPSATCRSGWCVAPITGQVTHDGKSTSEMECFKNDTCAALLAQHHAGKAATDGVSTFGNFKLLANGVIRDSGSGKVLATCNDKLGVDHKCVANFLRKKFAGSTGEKKKGLVSEKAGKPTAKFNKPAAASSSSRKPKQESSERPFSSPFFDRDKSDQQVIEDAWEDAGKRFQGLK